MKHFFFLVGIVFCFICCQNHINKKADYQKISSEIICNNKGCNGSYFGLEFIDGADVAHQFSNQMANKVGQQLKKMYRHGNYVKVDMPNIKMITDGMDNKDSVYYSLAVPFLKVADSCQACTAFDHRGGWGHEITEASVKNTFEAKNKLDYIEMKTTEGLQEFWIQWQHKDWQVNCK